MIANITCWVIAFGLIFSKSMATDELYIKLLFAMGFIFLGIISKAVDYYREVHVSATTNKNN